ncbi:MAG TPA: hypothetical protein VFM38_14295 [Candidatus Limnocylindrales bacterium]|nr:hypothetical protein [Candidatus Limnocylindrales bacterium]
MSETPRHRSPDPQPAETEEERLAQGPAGNIDPPGGIGTSAGGGHGTGSDKQSSGGSGDGEHAAGDDPETDWLRRVNEGETAAPIRAND